VTLEAGKFAQETEPDGADRSISLLADDYFGYTFFR
jgi:hypothetical protein